MERQMPSFRLGSPEPQRVWRPSMKSVGWEGGGTVWVRKREVSLVNLELEKGSRLGACDRSGFGDTYSGKVSILLVVEGC